MKIKKILRWHCRLSKYINHKVIQCILFWDQKQKNNLILFMSILFQSVFTQKQVCKAEINYTSLWRPAAEKRLNNWRRWIWSVIRRLSAWCFIAEVSQIGTDRWRFAVTCCLSSRSCEAAAESRTLGRWCSGRDGPFGGLPLPAETSHRCQSRCEEGPDDCQAI